MIGGGRLIDTYSLWPFFACIGLLLFLAAQPPFSLADAPPDPGPKRLVPIDGLRGFLALAVVFHHAATYHSFLLNGSWDCPSRFYEMLGEAGVSMFFMITGYLFWSRMIAQKGRPDWAQLYVGRVFRIGPLYMVAVITMLCIVLSQTGFRLNVRLHELAVQVCFWLGLGMLPRPDVNDFPGTTLILAGVTWSLRWEWAFYLLLPLTALVTRNPRLHLPATLAGLAGSVCWLAFDRVSQDQAYLCLFLAGMTCASLKSKGFPAVLPAMIASPLALSCLAGTLGLFDTAYAAGPVLLLALAFYLIASGCTVFGLLLTRPALRLGNISYGIYLLQGLVFAIVLRPAPMRAMFLASPVRHWLLAFVCAAVLVGVAAVAHAAVERTGIDLGKRVAAKARRWPLVTRAVPARQ